jgi:hypothetical protein
MNLKKPNLKLTRKNVIIILSVVAVVITALVVLGFSTFAGTVRKSKYISIYDLKTSENNIAFDYSINKPTGCAIYGVIHEVEVYDGSKALSEDGAFFRRLWGGFFNEYKYGSKVHFDLNNFSKVTQPNKTYKVVVTLSSSDGWGHPDSCNKSDNNIETVFFVRTQKSGQPLLVSQTPNYGATTVPKKSPNATYAKVGYSGSKVKVLQTNLNTYGRYGLVVDGSFGPKTEAAVKNYQKAKKVKQTGVVTNYLFDQLSKDIKAKTK